MIKAVVFDCFGVITVDLWRQFVRSLPDDQKEAARALLREVDAGRISLREFVDGVERLTGQRISFPFPADSPDQAKNSQLLDYIRELKKNYKIGLLSNSASNWIKDEFLTPEEASLFDDYTMSFEVGTTKPDPKIFLTAAKNLNVEPSEILYIDDIDRFTDAAARQGMKTVLYKNFDQMKKDVEAILANQR